MGIENGGAGENISRSVRLSQEIKVSNVFGVKVDEEANKVDAKAQDLLKKNFFPSEYRSVKEMLEIVNNNSSGESKRNAENALNDLATALVVAEPKMFDWMVSGQVDENLPISFRGISEKIANNWLVRDENDESGKWIVSQLREVEDFNIKAQKAPNIFEKKKPEFIEKKVEGMFEKLSELEDESDDALKLETVIGYLDSSVKKNNSRNEERKNYDSTGQKRKENSSNNQVDIELSDNNEASDNENGKEPIKIKWEITKEKLAEGMKLMEPLRWPSLTPPEWFNNLTPDEQYKVEVMVGMSDSAVNLLYAAKDLDKILGNNSTFAFTHEHMNKLFDPDFTLVMSKMVNDLCEFYTDQNGIKCLRYKEKFYKTTKDKDSPDGFAYDRPYNDPNKKRIPLEQNEENEKNGVRTIDEDVMKNLENINNYKEKLAEFLAKSRGREVSTMDKMSAYTAWNMVFGMGDSSVWDRMRILPTWNGIISDALRTLNPEYKALAKWQVLKSGRIKEDKSLFDAEYFSGPMADYVLTIMKMERDLGYDIKNDKKEIIGHVSIPIDGKKTMRDKIIDGEMSILSSKTYYGMLDFVNEGRDLERDNGKSLASLIMNYASFKENGSLDEEYKGKEIKFREGQVTFMNEFRDSLEAAITSYQYMTGKSDMKDLTVWSRTIKEKLGMLNGITWGEEGKNKRRPFSYTQSPWFWRDIIVGSFKADMNKLSTDCIYIQNPPSKEGNTLAYNLRVQGVVMNILGLSSMDVNVNKIMELLGVKVKEGKAANGFGKIVTSGVSESFILNNTRSLYDKQRKMNAKRMRIDSKEVVEAKRIVNNAKNYPGNTDFERLKREFKKALASGIDEQISGLATAIEEFESIKK